jgi:DNA topoisomerase-1
MRTDSVTLSNVAIEEARQVIEERFGKEYVPAKPRAYKSKAKNAQEAHEAIRPTGLARHPETLKTFLDSDELRLYKLIWERTIAAQMADALLDATTIDILAGEKFLFRSSGQVVRFPGFMKVYIEGKDTESEEVEGLLPSLDEKESLSFEELQGEEHTTQPPPRYTEASLVKILEENGIGRPSTYAATMNTLVERNYVQLIKRVAVFRQVRRLPIHRQHGRRSRRHCPWQRRMEVFPERLLGSFQARGRGCQRSPFCR